MHNVSKEENILKACKIADKDLESFGKEHGFPVIFVLQPIENEIGKFENKFKLTMFKKDQMHKAAEYARKVMGHLGIYNPNKLKSTPKSEHSIFNAIDEGDTLGITDHWVED